MALGVGEKVKMCSEKQRYTIQARDSRFVIMTKPFNARRTYLYTIADLMRRERGPCNLIFGLPVDCNNQEGANECLRWLNGYDGCGGWNEMAVSHRKCVPLTEAEVEQLQAA